MLLVMLTCHGAETCSAYSLHPEAENRRGVQKEEQEAQKEKEAAERKKREDAQKAEAEKRRLQVCLAPGVSGCKDWDWVCRDLCEAEAHDWHQQALMVLHVAT